MSAQDSFTDANRGRIVQAVTKTLVGLPPASRADVLDQVLNEEEHQCPPEVRAVLETYAESCREVGRTRGTMKALREAGLVSDLQENRDAAELYVSEHCPASLQLVAWCKAMKEEEGREEVER